MSYGERMSCWPTASCPRRPAHGVLSPAGQPGVDIPAAAEGVGINPRDPRRGQERAQCPLCREKPKASEGLGARVRQEAKNPGGDARVQSSETREEKAWGSRDPPAPQEQGRMVTVKCFLVSWDGSLCLLGQGTLTTHNRVGPRCFRALKN